MSYLTHPTAGHPEWNGQEPQDPEGPTFRGEAYRCLDCAWHARGGAKAYDHHRLAHHRIVLTHREAFGPIHFACCQTARTSVERTS